MLKHYKYHKQLVELKFGKLRYYFILVILDKFAKLPSTKLISLLIHQNFSPTKLPSFTVLNTICGKILKWENLTIHLFLHHLFLFRISFTCTCTCSSVISVLPSNWFRLTHWPCFSPPKLITYSIFLPLSFFLLPTKCHYGTDGRKRFFSYSSSRSILL